MNSNLISKADVHCKALVGTYEWLDDDHMPYQHYKTMHVLKPSSTLNSACHQQTNTGQESLATILLPNSSTLLPLLGKKCPITKLCNKLHPTWRTVHRILHIGVCLTLYQPHFSDFEEVNLHSSLLILKVEHTAWDAEIMKACSSNHKIKNNTLRESGISRYRSTDNLYPAIFMAE